MRRKRRNEPQNQNLRPPALTLPHHGTSIMKYQEAIDVALLNQYFRYCEISGKLFWRISPARAVKQGSECGYECSQGYRCVGFKGKYRKVHRIIWAMIHGSWPTEEIDHIDGNRSNNKPENLRCVTRLENRKNLKKRIDNSSGQIGVHWSSLCSKWRVGIVVNGKKTNMLFNSKDAAVAEAKRLHSQNGYSKRHQESIG